MTNREIGIDVFAFTSCASWVPLVTDLCSQFLNCLEFSHKVSLSGLCNPFIKIHSCFVLFSVLSQSCFCDELIHSACFCLSSVYMPICDSSSHLLYPPLLSPLSPSSPFPSLPPPPPPSIDVLQSHVTFNLLTQW